jgi:flagellar motility protein MotE (MotC chaperone)
MTAPFDREQTLQELEARQDEVLRQLEALERQLEALLAEYAPPQLAQETVVKAA